MLFLISNNMKVSIFLALYLVFKIYSCEECINFCGENIAIENGFTYNSSSDNICLFCDNYKNITQGLTFYINVTNITSYIKLQINELLFSISAKVKFEDITNEISYIFADNSSAIDGKKLQDSTNDFKKVMAFNSHTLKVSIEVCNNTNISSDYNFDEKNFSSTEATLRLFELSFNYSEVEYKYTEEYVDADNNRTDNTLKMDYESNRVHTWILERTQNNSYGIQIQIIHFDIDINSGDYLIVGTSMSPSDSSKALIISNPSNTVRSIVTNSSIAYIQLITHASIRTGKCLEIKWTPESKTYNQNCDHSISSKIRAEALNICIYAKCDQIDFYDNLTAYIAHFINTFIFHGSLDSDQFIDKSSVVLFDSAEKYQNSVSYCSAKLGITQYMDPDIPYLKRNDIHNILFGKNKNFIFKFSNEEIIITDCESDVMKVGEICETIVYIMLPLIIIIGILYLLKKNKKFKTESLDKLRKFGEIALKDSRINTFDDLPNLNTDKNYDENGLYSFESDNEITSESFNQMNGNNYRTLFANCKETLDRNLETTILECDDMEIIDVKRKPPKRISIDK